MKSSIHKKGSHSYGAPIRSSRGVRYSYHHNLFAHNASRNPRPGNYDENSHDVDPEGLLLDFRNNVLYSWRNSRPGYDADSTSVYRYNYVGNYAKLGPDSKLGHLYQAGSKYFRAYYSGNYYNIPDEPWSLVSLPGKRTERERVEYKQSLPFPAGPITTDTAQDAYDKVLAHAGVSVPWRGAVDSRVISDVRNGTGAIINHEEEVGGWPKYRTYDVPADGDHDGMPDDWEKTKGLNPADDTDRNEYDLSLEHLSVHAQEVEAHDLLKIGFTVTSLVQSLDHNFPTQRTVKNPVRLAAVGHRTVKVTVGTESNMVHTDQLYHIVDVGDKIVDRGAFDAGRRTRQPQLLIRAPQIRPVAHDANDAARRFNRDQLFVGRVTRIVGKPATILSFNIPSANMIGGNRNFVLLGDFRRVNGCLRVTMCQVDNHTQPNQLVDDLLAQFRQAAFLPGPTAEALACSLI